MNANGDNEESTETSIESGKNEHEKVEVLRELYIGQELGCRAIGNRFDITRHKIRSQIRKLGVMRPEQIASFPATESELRHLFLDEHHTIREVADILNTYRKKVERVKNHYGIDINTSEHRRARGRKNAAGKPASFYTNTQGYEMWKGYNRRNSDRQTEQIAVHRLVAVAKYGSDALENGVIHHKNSIPWDNRPANIEVTTPSKHIERHWDTDLSRKLGNASAQDIQAALRSVGYDDAAEHIVTTD